jgi:mannitol-specific phosphotransferase system IIBC component
MTTIDGSTVKNLIVACDAGMGSSVLLASMLKREFADSTVTVTHSSIAGIPLDADLVLTQQGTADRAREVAPGVPVVPFAAFRDDPAVARVVEAIRAGSSIDLED